MPFPIPGTLVASNTVSNWLNVTNNVVTYLLGSTVGTMALRLSTRQQMEI